MLGTLRIAWRSKVRATSCIRGTFVWIITTQGRHISCSWGTWEYIICIKLTWRLLRMYTLSWSCLIFWKLPHQLCVYCRTPWFWWRRAQSLQLPTKEQYCLLARCKFVCCSSYFFLLSSFKESNSKSSIWRKTCSNFVFTNTNSEKHRVQGCSICTPWHWHLV